MKPFNQAKQRINKAFQRFLSKLLFAIRNLYRKHEKTGKQEERTKFAKLHFGETKKLFRT